MALYKAKKTHMEVPMFLINTAIQLEAAVSANFVMYRTCYLQLGFNKSDCALLGRGLSDNTTTNLEDTTQPYTAVILMVAQILEFVIPTLGCFFIGPWSDRYGRKPVLVSATLGYVIAHLIMLIVSNLSQISPWYLMMAYIPICLTGGFPSLLTAMVCYVTDVTSEKRKGFRLGLLEAFLSAGSLLGGVSSSFIFNFIGYAGVYSICLMFSGMSLLFILLFVPESIQNREETGRFRNLIKFSLITNTFRSIFKKRKGLGRPTIVLIILTITFFYVSYQSEYNVAFLFLREKFFWSLRQFTIYNGINNVLWISGNFAGSYFLHNKLHVREIYIIIAGIACGVAGSLWQAIATESWHIYGGAWLKWFGGAVIAMCLTLLTKFVSSEESGKVVSSAAALRTLGHLAAVPIYTVVYNKSLSINTGIYNYLTAGICAAALISAIIVSVLEKRHSRPKTLESYDMVKNPK